MKKQTHRIWKIAVLALLGIAIIFSLFVPEEFLRESEPQRVEISILTRQIDGTVWTSARQGMEQAAEDYGAELRFLTLSTPNDGKEQIELLQREVDMGTDGAVVVPADCGQLEESLEKWRGFPVVTMESEVKGAKAGIIPDYQQAGTLLAQQAVRDLPKQAKVLLVGGCAKSTGIGIMQDAARQVLEQAGLSVEKYTKNADALPYDVQAVMCFDVQSLLRVMEVRKETEQSFRVYGTGMTNSLVAQLETGEISALAVWSEYAQGYLAVTQAVSAARKEKAENNVLPVTVVREGETYEPDHQKLLYPVSH